ncbi:MAG: hypothetical protein ACK5XN_40410, partial [Bacteroidota bacterium]
LTGGNLPVNHPRYGFSRKAPVAGRVMNKMTGKNIADLTYEDLKNIPAEAYQQLIDDIRLLNQNKLVVDLVGDNILYDQGKNKFNLLDLSKNDFDSNAEWIFAHESGKLSTNRVKEMMKQKMMSAFWKNNNYQAPNGYDSRWLNALQSRIINRVNNIKKKGGIIPKAQVGKTVNKIISNLNPFNFLVNDYTDKGDFNKAYRAAREQGEKEFLWNNKRYTTNYNGTLKEQLDQTGIIDVNKSKNTALRHQLIEGTYTGDAYDQYKYKDIIKDVLNPNKNVRNPYTDGVEKDLLRIYLGRPTKHNLVTLSKYKPTIAKGDKENLYYSIKDYGEFLNPSLNSLKKDEGFNTLKEYAQYLNDNKASGKINEQPYNVGLGDHTINYGKDDRGEYISYYDKWD